MGDKKSGQIEHINVRWCGFSLQHLASRKLSDYYLSKMSKRAVKRAISLYWVT